MADHVALDEEYQHGSFLEKVVKEERNLDRARARKALRSAFGLVETLEMWSSDILQHYLDPNSLPLTESRSYRRIST